MSPLAAVAAREQLHPLEAAGVLDLVEPVVEVDGALLYLTDAILRELHARLPDRGGGLDTDPGQAVESRRMLLDQAAERGVPVAAAHLERFYSVAPDGDAYRLKAI